MREGVGPDGRAFWLRVGEVENRWWDLGERWEKVKERRGEVSAFSTMVSFFSFFFFLGMVVGMFD